MKERTMMERLESMQVFSHQTISGPTWKATRTALDRRVRSIRISAILEASEHFSNAWEWSNMLTLSSRNRQQWRTRSLACRMGLPSCGSQGFERREEPGFDVRHHVRTGRRSAQGLQERPDPWMVGGSYVMFGWYGVATIPLLLFVCFFIQQRVWAGNSIANLWAIALLIDSFNAFTETEPSLFIEHLIREFPLHLSCCT